MAESKAHCPYCSAPLVQAGDIPKFEIEDIDTGLDQDENEPGSFWAISCGNCKKLLGILPPLVPGNTSQA